jgi:hypothetical protein
VHVSGIVDSGVTIDHGVSDRDQVVATAGAFLQVGESVKPVLDRASGSPASGAAPSAAAPSGTAARGAAKAAMSGS